MYQVVTALACHPKRPTHIMNTAKFTTSDSFEESSGASGNIIGLFQVRLSDDFIEYTPAFAQIVTGEYAKGLTRKEFISHVHPDDRLIRQAAFDYALQTGNLCYETRTIWNDGSIHWMRTVGGYLYDNKGNAYLFLGTVQEITDQWRRNKLLAEAESRFRSVVDQAPVAIALLKGYDMVVSMANDAMLRLWGKDRTIMYMPIISAMPELAGQPFLELLRGVYASGEPYFGYGHPARLDYGGNLVACFFDFVYTPVRNDGGTIDGVMVVATHVTTQVTSRRAVEQSEARFRNLIEEAPFATAVYRGRDMIIEVANQEMIQLWGKDWSVIGKPLAQALPELQGQPFLGLLDHVYTTEIPYHAKEDPATLEINGRLQTSYFNFTYKPLRDESG